MTTIIHKTAIALLFLGLTGPSAFCQTREPVRAQSAATDTGRITQVLEQCRQHGLTAADSRRILAPVYAAQAESLPPECILMKIEEGLAKKADPALIIQAAEERLEYLRQADQLMCSVHRGRGRGDSSHLVARIGIILESGLPEETLQKIFSRRGGGFRYGRILHVIDAGETLQLAGLSPEQTQLFMTDCIERNLSHPETERAVDFILAERANGRDFESIYRKLWVKPE